MRLVKAVAAGVAMLGVLGGSGTASTHGGGSRVAGGVIRTYPDTVYQTIHGVGGALTDSAAEEIAHSPARNEIMRALFQTGNLSVVRIPIGASDMSLSAYTFEDTPGEFSMAPAATTADLLRQARRLNPSLRVIAAPWSAPGWMKASGRLVSQCDGVRDYLINSLYSQYAAYLAEYAEKMRALGVSLYAVSLQNESANCDASYPTMLMEPGDEARLSLDLRAALGAAGLGSVSIVGYDDN